MEYRAVATNFVVNDAPEMLRRLGRRLGWIADDSDDEGWDEQAALEIKRSTREFLCKMKEEHEEWRRLEDCWQFKYDIISILDLKVQLCRLDDRLLPDKEEIRITEEKLAEAEATLVECNFPEFFLDYWNETSDINFDDFLEEMMFNPRAEDERQQENPGYYPYWLPEKENA